MLKCTKSRGWLFAAIIILLNIYGVNAQDRVKIALWGDSRENLDNATYEIADVLLNQITDWDFQVHTGDFSHDGSDAMWKRTFAVPGIKDLYKPGKFYMCTSNHEFKSPDSKENWDKYTKGILPTNSADGSTHFYAVHKSNVHVIFCDAYATDSLTMQKWLDNYLDKNVKSTDWVIAVWHNPAYEDLSYKESYLPKCKGWLESLYKHHCKFVFNGHAHVYIRTKPVNVNEKLDEKNGIVHVVNGTGGASWKDPVDLAPVTAFTPREKSFPCITFLTIEGNKAHLETIDARKGNKLKVIDMCDYSK